MIDDWRHLDRAHPRAADAVLATLLFAAAIPGSVLTGTHAATAPALWPALTLSALACAVLMWRRDHPRAVAVVAIAVSAVIAALGYLPTPLSLGALIVVLYTVAARTGRKTAAGFTLTAIALVVASSLLQERTDIPMELTVLGPIAWLLLPAAIGTAVSFGRAYITAERARADYAELTREEEAGRRVGQERLRIARELHDVVAHHLALANAQAGTLSYLMGSDDEQARAMVEELGGTIVGAMRDLKATVGLLRQSDDPGAPLEPAPGLAQLPALAAKLHDAGLRVHIQARGPVRALSAGSDLAAYRVIQEALTNVAKHAATDTADVRLAYGRDRLTITVTDDGPGRTAPTPGPGYGLIGMRERVQSAGGRLRTGPRRGGGFEVTADLPLPPPPPAPRQDTAA